MTEPAGGSSGSRNAEQMSQQVKDLTERLMLAEAQCFTHWELLRRLHDMIVVFDMEGIIVFISPAVQDMLGYAPTELFNQPLASILHPDCHGSFEGHVQRIMEIQFKRPLQGPELLSSFIFRSRSGVAVPLDGVGQAWQRGRNVEFVMSFRARHATAQGPAAATQTQGQMPMSGSIAQAGSSVPQQMNAPQHMLAEQQQHAAAAEGGSAVPHVMPPQQSGFQAQAQAQAQGQGSTAGMPPAHSAGMPSAGVYMGMGVSGGVSAPMMGSGGQPMYSHAGVSMGNGAVLNSMAGMPPQTHNMQPQQYQQQQPPQQLQQQQPPQMAQGWHGSGGMATMQGGHQMPHGMSGAMQMQPQPQHGGVLHQGVTSSHQ